MKGPHSDDAFLQVAAGPDVSEEGHAVRLRFIRTSRNTKMSPVRGAEQSGGSSAPRSYSGPRYCWAGWLPLSCWYRTPWGATVAGETGRAVWVVRRVPRLRFCP